MPGNPFANSPDQNARRIVGYGLRNPFRIAIRPGTNEVWGGDVGWSTWEELNRLVTPADATADNFGWPCYEGTGRQGSYDALNLNLCENLYAAGSRRRRCALLHVSAQRFDRQRGGLQQRPGLVHRGHGVLRGWRLPGRV